MAKIYVNEIKNKAENIGNVYQKISELINNSFFQEDQSEYFMEEIEKEKKNKQ